MNHYHVIVIGAGAAGLMCAIEAAKRDRRVLVIDHANKAGKKILMSGGGRCNFTNLNVKPENYLSHNPHFCKSALSRYTAQDFIALVEQYQIAYHEKTLGQLFCDQKSKDILNLLLNECRKHQADIHLNTEVTGIENRTEQAGDVFRLETSMGAHSCESLVIATGGLSIPTMGATAFGYEVAKQFGLKVWPTRAGLVPLTLSTRDKEKFAELSGISCHATVQNKKIQFDESMLFTHRGLSGPSVLQISSYWREGETVEFNLLPDTQVVELLQSAALEHPNRTLKTTLNEYLPKRLLQAFISESQLQKPLYQLNHKEIQQIALTLHHWEVKPNGSEGYRTAEVTLGGVDCNEISSKTMVANKVAGLYFIGEVLDVTGWLGGYNFQWAWSSGWVAGQYV